MAWFLFLGLKPARAETKPFKVTLEYVAGPGCPGAAEFKAVVVGRLGYDPFAAGAPDRVLVQVVPRSGAIEGRLEWRDAAGAWTGDQTFPTVTTDCARFARVVGFALAVQIQLLANVRADPDAPAAARKHRRATAPAPEPPAAAAAGRSSLSRPCRPQRAAIGSGARGGRRSRGRVRHGGLPDRLGRIFGVLAWTHVAIELAAQTSVPATTRRADGAGFSQQHLLLGAAGCAIFTRRGRRASWRTRARSGWPAWTSIARPRRSRRSSRRARAWAPSTAWGGAWSSGRTRTGSRALTRWRGTLDNLPVWTAPRLAAALGVDAVVRFP